MRRSPHSYHKSRAILSSRNVFLTVCKRNNKAPDNGLCYLCAAIIFSGPERDWHLINGNWPEMGCFRRKWGGIFFCKVVTDEVGKGWMVDQASEMRLGAAGVAAEGMVWLWLLAGVEG